MPEMNRAERQKKAESLAADILALARNSLLVNFRFLDRALSRLSFAPDENISIATDGEYLYYGPWVILAIYRDEQTAVARDVLHSLLHCVFRHNFIGRDIDRARWDLACDIAVENAINELQSDAVKCGRVRTQLAMTALVKDELPSLTAERIYKWLGDKNIPEDELISEREAFRGDSHGLWYGAFDPDAKADENISLRKLWEDVSKRMQTELETVARESSSALVQNLRSINRTRYSYTEFLKRFGVHGETMRLSEEEFDNNYYTYGLELYGNIPLIEALEYSEQKKLREFVIAIDTSGSVRGEVVQSFVQHTYDILMRRERLFDRLEVHIIQCDCEIREDACLTSADEIDSYIKGLEIKGLGKTDFRPVFEYVDRLRQQGQLRRLQGLIYFTDGFGTFPEHCPDYDTAFIIHGDGFDEPEMPDWAVHLALTEDEILDKRF